METGKGIRERERRKRNPERERGEETGDSEETIGKQDKQAAKKRAQKNTKIRERKEREKRRKGRGVPVLHILLTGTVHPAQSVGKNRGIFHAGPQKTVQGRKAEEPVRFVRRDHKGNVIPMNYLENLSPVLQALLASLFTWLMTTAGAFVIFFTDRPNRGFSVVAESSAAGIMLAASFFSLLNPAFDYPSSVPPAVAVTAGFCLGGGLVLLADRLLSRSERAAKSEDAGKLKSRLLYAAVTLHNVPEGLAVGVAFAGGGPLAAAMLAFGIGIQNLPEGLCVACPLRARGMSRKKSFLLSSLSGAVEIPSAVIGAVAATFVGSLMPWALSFAAGAMIAVSASELIPGSFTEHKPLAFVGLIAGFALMMFLDVALG